MCSLSLTADPIYLFGWKATLVVIQNPDSYNHPEISASLRTAAS